MDTMTGNRQQASIQSGWTMPLLVSLPEPTTGGGGGGDETPWGHGGRGRRTRCLVLVSTRDPQPLVRRVVLGRAAERPTEFHVVVTRRRDLAQTAIVALAVGGGMVVDPLPSVGIDQDAAVLADRYLGTLLAPLRGEVTAISGSVGEANPLTALSNALRGFGGDDILVVTRSNRLARILRFDLCSRAARRFRLPVRDVADS